MLNQTLICVLNSEGIRSCVLLGLKELFFLLFVLHLINHMTQILVVNCVYSLHSNQVMLLLYKFKVWLLLLF